MKLTSGRVHLSTGEVNLMSTLWWIRACLDLDESGCHVECRRRLAESWTSVGSDQVQYSGNNKYAYFNNTSLWLFTQYIQLHDWGMVTMDVKMYKVIITDHQRPLLCSSSSKASICTVSSLPHSFQRVAISFQTSIVRCMPTHLWNARRTVTARPSVK